MTPHPLTRRPTLIQVRLWTGLVVGVYVTMHLLNHALGLISVGAQEAARPWVMAVWHSWPGQAALYGSFLAHAVLGLHALVRRRVYRLPLWEGAQIVVGLLIPYILLFHVVNTRGTRILTRIDIDYVYEITMLWVDPSKRYWQVTLVLLVWAHFVAGLHFWMRGKRRYAQWRSAWVLFYVMVPVLGLLGFAHVGAQMTARAAADPGWYKSVRERGRPADAGNAKIRAALQARVGNAWLGVVAAAFVAAQVRNWLGRGRLFSVTYPEARTVRAMIGTSILEVSRQARRPHMSVCGGRARCTTCRVRVLSSACDLPPPAAAETAALRRIGAPPGLRLACQTRPLADLSVLPLLDPTLVARGGGDAPAASEFGHEREVTVLFIDLRASTQMAEGKMPYDVVFLLNLFFAEMSAAVDAAGGYYSNFTGDGLMALFGLRATGDHGARAALACAADMLDRTDAINSRMACELRAPMRIGVGIHTGHAIVGRMGPPKRPIISAIGDTVNTAARLEGLTKDFAAPVVASVDTLTAAGQPIAGLRVREATLRGRDESLSVVALDRDALATVTDAKRAPAPAPAPAAAR